MARHIRIAGVDRFSDYIGGSLDISRLLAAAVDTCSFKVRGTQPAWGAEVIVEDDLLGVLFAGHIVSVELDPYDPVMATQVWQVGCDDYTWRLNGKLVNERFQSVNATDAFLYLADLYAPDFTTVHVQNCTTVIDFLEVIDVPTGDAFTKICEQVGWHWFPDDQKDLHFFSLAGGEDAPLELHPGGNFKGFSLKADGRTIKNRVTVRGGLGTANYTMTASFPGNGSTRSWTLPMLPAALPVGARVVITGGANPSYRTVGWDGLDDESQFHFLVNASSGELKATSIQSTPASGYTVSLAFYPKVPIIVMAEDYESQVAMAAIFGGDGILEDVVVDASLANISQAQALANAKLREWANPKTQVKFETYSTGWWPGQIVTVDLPDRNAQGQFLVQEVSVKPYTADDWVTTITAGSTLKGLADWLAELAKVQKAVRPDEVKTVDKVKSLTDTLVIDDTFSIVVSTGVPISEVGTGEVGTAEVT